MRIGEKWKVAVRRYEYHKGIWYNYREAEVLDISFNIFTLRVVYKTSFFGLIKHKKTIMVGVENIIFSKRLG
jgi:hypothetical protein